MGKYRLWLRVSGQENEIYEDGLRVKDQLLPSHFIVDSYEQYSEGSLVAAEGSFSDDDGDVEDDALEKSIKKHVQSHCSAH